MKTQKLAAIDIGSNSLKLVIVEAAASDSFTVILQERERVRLGHDTLKTHLLSAEAINLSAATIAKFRSIAESRSVDSIIAVATASVREADNSAEFVREIEERTGVRVEVLSSVEEARLIGIAAAQFFDAKNETLLNIDIGGGSTELSLMKNGEPYKLFSMKLGAVGLTERFIFSNPPRTKELENLQAEITFALERPLRKMKNQTWQISTGTSGTIMNLTTLLNFQTAETANAQPEIQFKKLVALNKMLARIPLEERAKLPSISLSRAEVIVAGGQILEGVMRAFKIEKLQPCGYALREGVIIDYLREIESESLPPVPDVEDKKLRDVFAVGRRFGYEESHALQVADLAEKMFDALEPIYKIGRPNRTLLAAAALLHDVGYHISHESHHKHSFYLIKNSEMTGFSEPEKTIIALVARYHRGSLPKEKHAEFMQLNERDRQTVARLGAILRLAEALDRGHENHIQNVKFKREKNVLSLKLVSDKDCQIERQAIEQKKDLFELAFECSLQVL
ncbi:MAG: Ppx/GppA family phosphatase [Pyrinomonadaceae bacterium]|nr:Ppx/GppA family phosphatase [Pyrinomonadaceae bacterium]